MCREGLDWVVDQAREYGMRLVLTLTNGDAGYGGMPQYAKWHEFDTVTGFYTLPAVKVTLSAWRADFSMTVEAKRRMNIGSSATVRATRLSG